MADLERIEDLTRRLHEIPDRLLAVFLECGVKPDSSEATKIKAEFYQGEVKEIADELIHALDCCDEVKVFEA